MRGPVWVAVAAFLVSLAVTQSQAGGAVCASHMHGVSGTSCSSLMMFDWMLMVAAMMPPLVVPVIGHVWRSSFPGRRADSVLSFALGYASVWGLAGILLMPAAADLARILPGWGASLAFLALSIGWSSSPLAQVARNRGHRVRSINPYGFAADRDSFLQGLLTGCPCVLACWTWMLVPMAAPTGNHLLMVGVTAVLFLESLAPPKRPLWQTPPAIVMLRQLATT